MRVSILGAAAVALVLLLVQVATTGPSRSACGAVPPNHGAIAPAVYALLAAVGYFAGGLLGLWRQRRTAPLPGVDSATPDEIVLHAVLLALLGLTLAALAYETYALSVPGVWPITYYVRCANVVAPGWMLAGVVALAFLSGHWLWRPAV